jgi:hypothetical protein
MRNKKIEFANFVCRSGDKVLLDLYDSIIEPAFFGKNLIRKYGNSSYILEDVRLDNLGSETSPVPIITGRIVKDSILKIEQRRVGGELKEVDEIHPTSPSSIFCLYLHNHRLIYVREHIGSPNLDAFQATLEFFIRKLHSLQIKQLLAEMRKITPKSNWKERSSIMKNNFPIPTLDILPLGDPRGMNEAINSLDSISKVSLLVVRTNDELNTNPFFDAIRNEKEKMGNPDKAKIEFSSKDGILNKQETILLAQNAIDDQSVRITIQGHQADQKVSYSNSSDETEKNTNIIALTVDIANNDSTPLQIANQGLQQLESLTKHGKIKEICMANFNDFILPKLKKILARGVSNEQP